MQPMHKGLNHQDVVGLEQEYAAKRTQFSEQEAKKAKVDTLSPLNVASNCVTPVNKEPANSSNNSVPVNEVLAVAVNNEEDRFEGMYPLA